ncbi:MAG: hypothetical protein IJU19_03190 [Bacteroidales bacterium]|nr:hypothetical protein [Bacteroidales bacterium]
MKKQSIIGRVAALTLMVWAGTMPMAAGQNDGGYNESVVVKGAYRPVLELREKVNFPATISDTFPQAIRNFQYGITPVRLKALYEPTRIKAARLVGEPATRLYNNYLRIGFGNHWTPMGDLYWSSTRDKRKTYGLRVNHLSSWGKIDGYGKNHYGNTMAMVFGKYIVGETLQLSTDLGYEHDHNLYYGFNDDMLGKVFPTYTRDSIGVADYRASYNVATWNIGLKNMQLDPNKLGYAANVSVRDMWALWGQNEFTLTLSGDVHYGFSVVEHYKGVAYLHAEWEGYANQLQQGEKWPLGHRLPVADTAKGYRNIVRVNPYADLMLGGFQVHGGLLAAVDAYSVDSANTLRIFPDVVVSKEMLKGALSVSVAATGGLEANSWNSIRIVNPYLTPGAEQRASYHYDFTGNARWNISRKLEARASVGYSLLRDDLSFQLDTTYRLGNVYRPYYMDCNRFSIGAMVAFVNDEMLTLQGGGHLYSYTMAGEDSLLSYRPRWDLTLGADVNYHDKWLLHLTGQLIGSMEGEAGKTLPARYGIAAEVEYRHNKALSFFLKADNLAFQRYYYWSHYPSHRGLFLIGATYTIPHK